MIAGQAGRAVFFAVMAWAVHVRLGFWPASGILGLSYLAGSFYQPVADAAVSDLVPRERRLEAYALLRVANNLGWGVGPMLGGMVSEIGYAWLFVFGGLTSAISSWLIWRHLAETHDSGRRAAMVRDIGPQGWKDVFEIRRDPRFLGFCVITLFLFIAMSQWLATLSVYASGRLGVSRTQLGLLFGMNGLLVVVFQFPVVRAIRRLSLAAALALGSLVYAVSFFSVAFAGNYAHLVLCMIAITLGELIASPPGTSLASLMAPPERMGRYLGWYGLTAVAGWSVGPFIGASCSIAGRSSPCSCGARCRSLLSEPPGGFGASAARTRTAAPRSLPNPLPAPVKEKNREHGSRFIPSGSRSAPEPPVRSISPYSPYSLFSLPQVVAFTGTLGFGSIWYCVKPLGGDAVPVIAPLLS